MKKCSRPGPHLNYSTLFRRPTSHSHIASPFPLTRSNVSVRVSRPSAAYEKGRQQSCR